MTTIDAGALTARPSPFAVFRRRNFTLLWTAQFISTMGSGLTAIAASILVFRVTGSALSVGFMLLATSLPSLLIGLIAGTAVDRFDRKRIMVVSNLWCGLTIAAIPSMLPFGIGWLYVLVALSSAVAQFFAPAQASVLPETAPDTELVAANAMMTISQYGALTLGYAAAGLIATFGSLTRAFYLDALSFGLSALCILPIQVAPLTGRQEGSPAAMMQNLRVGLGVVRETPVLRSLVLLFVPIFCVYGFSNSLQLAFATRALSATSFEYSLIEGVFSVGFVAGSLIMATVADRMHAGQWIAVSILGMGAWAIGFALSWSVWFAIACSTMVGVLNAPSYLGRQLLIQHATPREVRGRVSSVFFVTRDTGFMLGMAAAGLADVFDVRLLLVISALALLACGARALILPGIGQPSAEWRHMLAMLRAGPSAPGLGLGHPATLADIDRLGLRLPELGSLSGRERQELARRTRVYAVPPATAIVRQGEQSTMAYFLLDGRTVTSRAEGGAKHILSIHNPGDFFGEIAALTKLPRTASVLAEQPTTLLQVPAPALQTLMRDPKLKRLILDKMAVRLQRINMMEIPPLVGLPSDTLSELRALMPQQPSVER